MSIQDLTKCFLVAISFVVVTRSGYAQQHAPETAPDKWLWIAGAQFKEENYALATQSAQQFIDASGGLTDVKTGNELNKARYYISVSRLKTNEEQGIDDARTLIATTPIAAYKQRTAYALAEYYFRHNRLAAAIPYYEMAGIANLTNEEIANEKFELAYCYFNNRQLDKAEPLFASIKELQKGKYYGAGNYYYGLLAYNANNYNAALISFDRIKDLSQYSNIVPYYIAEIYYFTGDRKRALAEAEALVKRPEKLYYNNELNLLAAQCLFEEQKFKAALPYFEFYYDNVEKIRKEDLYEMAYCYYRTDKWQQAIDKFKLLSNTQDSLGQTAMYLLGDSYLKTGDKTSARNAFSLCADMPFNTGLQETALLLYAKLSYEMGYNGEASTALKSLLKNFRHSKYTDEAKTLLSDLLVKTNNYYEAYLYLTEVKDKNAAYWRVYQKVVYGYALQQADLGNIRVADSLLATTLQHAEDKKYESAAFFWSGELAYREHNYDNTIRFSKDFLNTAASNGDVTQISKTATRQHAYLNMGYAAMEQNNYAAARQYFNDAQQKGTSVIADDNDNQEALLHEADAVFMTKDFTHAFNLYDKIIAGNGSDAEYAKYQKSIIYGLQGHTTEKIALLQQVMSKGQLSPLASQARYELGVTYIEISKYKDAIAILQPLVTATGNSFAAKALLKTGFAYQQLDDNTNAITAYKSVVTRFPASEERPAAVEALKSLYVENNEPAAYAQFLKDNNIAASSDNVLDSTYYNAAEIQFASGKWDKARDAMSKYLTQFPTGTFLIKAHYYRGESNYLLKDHKAALVDYNTILQGPVNEFTENSALRAANIAYEDNDPKNAQADYHLLRNTASNKKNIGIAYSGLMKTHFYANQFDSSSAYADSVIAMPQPDSALLSIALLYKAKTLTETKNAGAAQPYFQQLQNNTDNNIAAEAQYNIAAYAYEQNNTKEAEKLANATIRRSAGSDYWVIRSYILLSDILVKEKDYFNAKATLQSIVKNTTIPELKQEAMKKLEKVKAMDKNKANFLKNKVRSMKKIVSILIVGLAAVLHAAAQTAVPAKDTTIKGATIEIIQSYKPEVKQRPKQEYTPVLPPVDNTYPAFNYVVPQQILSYTYNSLPLRPLALGKDTTPAPYPNCIKLGGGNLSTLYVDAGVSSIKGKNYETAFHLHSITQKGTIQYQSSSINDLEGDGTLHKNRKLWHGFVNAVYNKYGYYGFDHDRYQPPADSVKQAYTGVRIGADIQPENAANTDLTYHPGISAAIYAGKFSTTETKITLNAPFYYKLDSSLDAEVAASGMITEYKNATQSYSNNIFQFDAGLNYHTKSFTAHAYISPAVGSNETYFLPNLGATYNIPRTLFTVEAGWQAKVRQNTYEQLTTENPYIFNSFVAGPLPYTPLQTRTDEVYGGIQTNLGNHISLSGRISWWQYDHLPVYVNSYGDRKQFNVLYDDHLNATSFQATLTYHVSSKFAADAQGSFFTYFNGSLSRPWEQPGVRIKGSLYYRPLPALTISAYASLLDQLYAYNLQTTQTTQMNGVLDVGGNAEYLLIPRLSLFLQVTNLLNNKNERWLGYEAYGINIYGGLRFKILIL